MRRLLQINTTGNSGSTGRITEEIGRMALEFGWDSYIAFARNDRPSQSKKLIVGTDWDLKIHGLKTRLFDKHGFGSKEATFRLIKEIEKINPHIIHLHNLHGYYLNIEILFKFLANSKIPVVWTLHDCWAFTGHCTHFSYIDCEKWETHCEECPQKKEYPASYLFDRSYQNYIEKRKIFNLIENIKLVTVSEWLNSIVKRSFLKEHYITTIYNGIDLDTFHPIIETDIIKKKLNIHGKFVLLAVASLWIDKKGLYEYIKLSKYLKEDEIILLVGNINKNIKLPHNVHHIGRIDDVSELSSLYSSANVVMNLSFQETFGMTTAEGFACGTPSIAYNCTASPELISIDTGYIAEVGDFESIRNSLDLIKEKGKKFYQSKCIDRARKLYDKNDRYKEYLELYKTMFS